VSPAAYERDTYPWYRVRSPVYDAVYISPHMDDAVYSCGGQIAQQREQGRRVLVVTLFGNGQDSEQGTGVFGDIAQRKLEERAALTRLDVDFIWLNYPDMLMREKSLSELSRLLVPFARLGPSELGAQLGAALHVICARLLAPAGRAYFPFAVGAHPDHRLTFEVGRELSSNTGFAITFYEDVPYAQVAAQRDERLHHLGIVAATAPAIRAARDVHDFWFAHAKRWQRPFTRAAVLVHLLTVRGLFGVLGTPGEWGRTLELQELAIDDVLDRKVAAMRDYVTQTSYFYPPGTALLDLLCRSGAHYVERYWTPRTMSGKPAQPASASYLAREHRKLDALLRELAQPAAD
jgi:LmbE family N-acetylglucosaminyl deacetylase